MAKVRFYFDKRISSTKIIDLWSKVYGRELDISYIKWRFFCNPNDKRIFASYIMKNNLIAAYYSVSPAALFIDGKPLRAGLMNMLMTHPDHRGKGYSVEVEQALHEAIKERGIHALYGFANHQAHRFHRKHAGWKDLAILNIMKCKKQNFKPTVMKSNTKLFFETGKISKEIISKTEGMFVTKNRIWLSRDIKNTLWRLYDNPVNEYLYIAIRQRDKTVGIIFFKYYQETVDLMEFFFDNINDHIQVLGAGLKNLFEKQKVTAINLWSNLYTMEHLYLEKIGFTETSFSTYFGVIPLIQSKELLDYQNWHYRFFDSDVF